MRDLIGKQLGNYHLKSLLGQGGFGEVYLAEHVHLGTLAAIKMLYMHLGSNEVESFREEARFIARLVHPNIIRVFDFGIEDSSIPYFIMDYAPNGTLAQRHPKETIVPSETIVAYVKQIASALQFAHDQRIIHRDVKPHNMLIGSNNQILLSDFGIAVTASDSIDQSTKDRTGTPAYMAPEQIQGKPQLASDQYALGITVYQWLCGELPYTYKGNAGAMEILFQHIYEQPTPLREKVPAISPNVENVVLKALSKEPKQRYEKVTDFANALEQAVLSASIVFADPIVSPEYSSYFDEFVTRSNPPASPLLDLEDDGIEQPVVPDESTASGLDAVASSLKVYIVPPEATLPTFDLGEETHQQPINPTSENSPEMQIAPPVSSTLLFTQTVPSQSDLRDFFIMYTRADRTWAKWVAWELEDAKYSVILPPWYLHSQSDFDMEMEKAAAKAKRIVIILSADCLNTLNAQPAHITILKKEATHYFNKLLPICVRECGNEYRQLLNSLHHIDIAGEDELTARTILLAGIQDEGVRQTIRPSFPGTTIRRAVEVEPTFPQAPLTMTQAQFTGVTNLSYHTLSIPTATPSSPIQSIEIFFSYSHRDKKLRDELEKFMSHLKRHPSIKSWHDGEIGAGMVWAQEIDKHLSTANVILLLVSQDFIASNYCYDIEMQKAIQRHEAGEARVIPIILHPAFWEDTPIGKLQALPTGARPITLWTKRNLAFMDVVKGIQRAIEQLAGKV